MSIGLGICVRAASTELSGSFLESLVDASRDQLSTLPGHLLPRVLSAPWFDRSDALHSLGGRRHGGW